MRKMDNAVTGVAVEFCGRYLATAEAFLQRIEHRMG